jgi:hypothetical protein
MGKPSVGAPISLVSVVCAVKLTACMNLQKLTLKCIVNHIYAKLMLAVTILVS